MPRRRRGRSGPTEGHSARALYIEANRVGRDQFASAVKTLVLAYAGASLPLLLFFAQGNQPLGRLLTGELVAVDIVRMLVGSIGLVISVPATTFLAALVLSRTDDIPAGDGHNHGHAHLPAGPIPAVTPTHDHTGRASWPALPRNDEPTQPWF